MAHEAARQFIEQAADGIRKGHYREAVDLLERALRLNGEDPEAHLLMGVARSAQGERDPATRNFQRSIELDPQNGRAFYNYAVHLYGAGDKSTALEMSREAVRVDPEYGQARDMALRIERETGAEKVDLPEPTPRDPTRHELSQEMISQQLYQEPPTPYYRAGYYADYELPVHSIAFIERMGRWWDVVGWLLAIVGAGIFVVSIFSSLHNLNQMSLLLHGQISLSTFATPTFWQAALQLAIICEPLFLIIWMCFDISDRRGNWFWILPLLVLCCVNLSWLVQVIYIPTGRPSRWNGPKAS